MMKNKPSGTFKRIIKMLFKSYPKLVPITIFCILFSSATAALPALFIEKVVKIIEKWQKIGDWNSAKV
ncbi:MAG: ABC transporter ATP-binding protein, partial [Clostridia bacterium]|nr:ABC transporter ATP-binding protein [Clostridia bacterium]